MPQMLCTPSLNCCKVWVALNLTLLFISKLPCLLWHPHLGLAADVSAGREELERAEVARMELETRLDTLKEELLAAREELAVVSLMRVAGPQILV